MSIVRRWQSGAETGSLSEMPVVSGGASAVVTTPVKTGTYSYRFYYNGNYGQISISDTLQVHVGFFWNSPPFTSTSTLNRVLTLLTSGGTEIISIRVKGPNSPLELYINSVLQDTKNFLYTDDVWIHIGLDAYIDTSSGWANVFIDGTQELSFSGNTTSNNIGIVRFGSPAGGAASPAYWDDIYIDDTSGESEASILSILRFYSISPNANGNYSQWLGSDGDSANNYQLVDEIPPSDSDYVVTTGTNNLDSYNMSTFTLEAGEVIDAIIPVVRTKRTNGTEQIVIGSRLSSTDLLGTVQNPGTSFGYLYERLTGTPAGGSWQQSDLNNIELLIASTGSY